MSAVSKKAEKILRTVQEAILAEPTNFNMDSFVTHVSEYDELVLERGTIYVSGGQQQKAPACGTTCCIAGHIAVSTPQGRKALRDHGGSVKNVDGQLRVTFPFDDSVCASIAEDVTGTTNVSKLFYTDEDNWPEPYLSRYYKAKTAKQRAKVAVARIEHFIQTGK